MNNHSEAATSPYNILVRGIQYIVAIVEILQGRHLLYRNKRKFCTNNQSLLLRKTLYRITCNRITRRILMSCSRCLYVWRFGWIAYMVILQLREVVKIYGRFLYKRRQADNLDWCAHGHVFIYSLQKVYTHEEFPYAMLTSVCDESKQTKVEVYSLVSKL